MPPCHTTAAARPQQVLVRTCSMQGVVPQTITWYLPILLRLNMV